MRKVLGFFISRWFLTFVGACIVAALIWFFGPVVGHRRPASAGAVLAAGRLDRVRLPDLADEQSAPHAQVQRKADKQLVEAIAKPVADDPNAVASAEEVALLQERLRDALQSMRRAKLGGRFGRKYLYQLPWYMFIGPPGAGKTTALTNSGLSFPLADGPGAPAAVVCRASAAPATATGGSPTRRC